jgi:hypothetical protein
VDENRRMFIKNMAFAGGCAFISLSPVKLFGDKVGGSYQETRKILKKAYGREIQAHMAYTKFSSSFSSIRSFSQGREIWLPQNLSAFSFSLDATAHTCDVADFPYNLDLEAGEKDSWRMPQDPAWDL